MNRSACFIVLMATATLADASPWTYRGTLNVKLPANPNFRVVEALIADDAGQTILTLSTIMGK